MRKDRIAISKLKELELDTQGKPWKQLLPAPKPPEVHRTPAYLRRQAARLAKRLAPTNPTDSGQGDLGMKMSVIDNLLVERQYTLPSNGDLLMMDLFALYTLWWSEGSGRAAYGRMGHNDSDVTVGSHGRAAAINYAFEECLATATRVLLHDARCAIHDELTDIIDETLIPTDELIKWCVGRPRIAWIIMRDVNGKSTKSDEFLQAGMAQLPPFAEIGYDNAIEMFSCPLWVEYAELFGGPLWVKITEAVKNLDAHKDASPKDLMFWIDRLYDMEHNTGRLGEKLSPRSRVSTKALDLRARLTTAKDFLPYVSDQVKRLIRQ